MSKYCAVRILSFWFIQQMKIQVVKHIEILIINVELYSEKPNNDLQFWVFEEDQKIPTSPRIIFF